MQAHHICAIAIAAIAVSGCAGITDVIQKREALYQAQPIHAQNEHPARDAYRKSLSAARAAYAARISKADAASTPVELIDSGIVAVNSNCRAWFAAVSLADLRWRQGETNVSVLQGLITGVLAAAGVHADVMLAYGLGAAAYAGFSQGFLANVLFMADYDLQSKVREALAARAQALRAQAPGMTFVQAFDAIEDYEQICMPQSAKALARSAMAAVTTTISPVGAIAIAPAPVPPAAVAAAVAASAAATAAASTYLKDDSSERIVAYWMPGGQIDQANQVKLHAWMGEKGIFASIPFFAHAKIYELARKQLVADLKLPEASK